MLQGMSSPTRSKSTLRIPSLRQQDIAQPPAGTIEQTMEFVQARDRLLVITGAGLSTNSGIPAYRDQKGEWLRRTPIFYQDFIRCPIARRRYWARSYFGWHHVAQSKPNAGHLGLANMEKEGLIKHLITQNVDGLHQRAGSRIAIEVHGQLGRVRCLDCHAQYSRCEIQARLKEMNRDWSAEVLGHNPDGDVDLDEAAYPNFQIADCARCQGRLKPDVVFFGESVPPTISTAIHAAIEQCDGVLVIGSSLVVMSGYRVVTAAHAMRKPVAAINQGRTRADGLLQFKVDADCVEAISSICSAR